MTDWTDTESGYQCVIIGQWGYVFAPIEHVRLMAHLIRYAPCSHKIEHSRSAPDNAWCLGFNAGDLADVPHMIEECGKVAKFVKVFSNFFRTMPKQATR